MDDLLQEFLAETAESLAAVDLELVRFERDTSDATILGNIFRLMHTIKGTCGFLGLPRLGALAHAGETILGRFRDGELAVSPAAVTLILKAIDRIRVLLQALEQTGAEAAGDDADLIGQIGRMAEGGAPPPATEQGFPVAAELLVEVAQALSPAQPPLPAAEPEKSEPESARPAAEHPEAKDLSTASSSIRVNVDVIENLMTLISELVLTRNQLLQMQRSQKDNEFKVPLQRLSHITSDLQDGVTRMRMQPIVAVRSARLTRKIENRAKSHSPAARSASVSDGLFRIPLGCRLSADRSEFDATSDIV